MTSADWDLLLKAVGGDNPTQDSFDVCFAIAQREVDCQVLTVTFQDAETKLVERLYSSKPEAWAVGGKKPLSVGKWSQAVIERREPFVANSYAEMAEVFNDHAVSEGLGLGAIVNVPIIFNGVVRGTANVLNVPGFYDQARIDKVMALKPMFTMAMLTAM